MSTGSLSPPPDEPKSQIAHKPDPQTNGNKMPSIASGSNGTLTPMSGASPVKPEPIDVDVDGDDERKPYGNKVKMEEHKRLYAEEEKKVRDLEPPPAERLEDDWQVAYVWAFIIKFNQRDKIRGLETLADFERCLTEPVALRPDDVLENILIQFLKNLKPALRTLTAETIQSSVSNYISEQLLNSSEFTVWDRPWASNEEVRGGCCNGAKNRTELGRLRYYGEPSQDRVEKNPIKRMVDQGGGLFELDWRERAKLLRQLVDWQLSHADVIRNTINKEYKVPGVSAKKDAKAQPELVSGSVRLEPLGQDRNKNRIWSIDSSTRLYRSGNPFKRPCPLVSFSHTRDDFDSTISSYDTFAAEPVVKPEGKGAKGKLTAAQSNQFKKAVRSREEEKNLADGLREMIPVIEKEEQRVQRAKKRVAAAAEMANMAEWRSTRTRRPTRRVDYAYDGVGDEDDDTYQEAPTTSKRRRGEPEFALGLDDRGRPIIPGERKSTRVAIRQASEEPYEQSGPSGPSEGDEVGSGIEIDEGKSTDGYTNGDDVDGDEPNGMITHEARSEEIVVD